MKTFDYLIENYSEDQVADAMNYIENLIYSEVLDIDAITKWDEIHRALKENREIRQIDYEKTIVPQMMIDDLNFDKAVRRKINTITETIFFEMDIEQFEIWVFNKEIMMFDVKKMRA